MFISLGILYLKHELLPVLKIGDRIQLLGLWYGDFTGIEVVGFMVRGVLRSSVVVVGVHEALFWIWCKNDGGQRCLIFLWSKIMVIYPGILLIFLCLSHSRIKSVGVSGELCFII